MKIFGSRRHEDFKLIVNMPFLAKDIHSLEEYFARKKNVRIKSHAIFMKR
ncbi:hypothetical protein OE903_06360 [Bacillus sp. B6(2022)]|nr:hypothetical protein [Bacillus sp. B6(2022)]